MFVVARALPGIIPPFKINEWDGTPLTGTFYAQDFQNVSLADNNLFDVEKIVK